MAQTPKMFGGDASETEPGHAGGLQWPVLADFGTLDCAVWACDLLNDDGDTNAPARHAGRVPYAELAVAIAGQLKLMSPQSLREGL